MLVVFSSKNELSNLFMMPYWPNSYIWTLTAWEHHAAQRPVIYVGNYLEQYKGLVTEAF